MIRKRDPCDVLREIYEQDAAYDAKKDDFEFIHLKPKELKLLKQSEKDWTKITNKNKFAAFRLQNLHLAKVSRTDWKDKENIEFCEIRNRGITYLRYLEGTQKNKSSEHIHDWLITIFSAFAGALLSRPIWYGIDWFLEFIAQIIAKQ